ncbi:hypothetical protein AA106_19835 [Photorhabdus laumondii subsp. laumondii]|uniref:Photorhabdus luminescens subsp. laumondii TTO1 complete genome segment 4/17 n=1 Tax=Photorhabdus laumondii subsp. laumondii (strain DSM 15139 / CIP 105565 / TT01) TaxID=243265 RepID=Q7N7R4_PHOLL|nr:hypothetical protein [Photorhabdus laumondii]AWK40957.1 hypothetical protein A4R40_05190 [Photorhabdus laumondii subsp. laumondii]RAW67560.1 hypothetical protein CKY15_19415 [Photorhabdus sp. S7-51]RAW68435.1 hypothetical protein CKY14_19430 [Photorhabdus sp. S14-60]RAW73637.1 hypothetical protein CKY06_19680 [Photorhabdus sp. S15-56]RAW81129.1 hypothetical protein CKY12_20345 [Photorhabdus sp. S12-55]RAW81166.1 hypothetical protein CKY09_19990 [Photorhabdus sp. S5P8-50]CAE13339.1 unnamed
MLLLQQQCPKDIVVVIADRGCSVVSQLKWFIVVTIALLQQPRAEMVLILLFRQEKMTIKKSLHRWNLSNFTRKTKLSD